MKTEKLTVTVEMTSGDDPDDDGDPERPLQVGDRVRVVNTGYDDWDGRIGRVEEIEDVPFYGVAIDGEGWRGRHFAEDTLTRIDDVAYAGGEATGSQLLPFPTIAEAIVAANAGDIIYVAPGATIDDPAEAPTSPDLATGKYLDALCSGVYRKPEESDSELRKRADAGITGRSADLIFADDPLPVCRIPCAFHGSGQCDICPDRPGYHPQPWDGRQRVPEGWTVAMRHGSTAPVWSKK